MFQDKGESIPLVLERAQVGGRVRKVVQHQPASAGGSENEERISRMLCPAQQRVQVRWALGPVRE